MYLSRKLEPVRRRWRILSLLGAIALQGLLSHTVSAQSLEITPTNSEIRSTSTFPSDYLLGFGDQVSITVLGYDEYTGLYTILPDGTINLPLVGSVVAENLTPQAFTQELTARLNEYLVDPTVTVAPVILRPVVVTVAGQVERPGPIQLQNLTVATFTANTSITTDTTGSRSPTVSAAILEVGGITSNADIQQIIIKRTLGNGEVATTTVNLWEALVSGNPAQDLILQDGDAVFVPALPENSTFDRRLLVESTLAPAVIPVQVIGEVMSPGQVQVTPNSTISQALAIAGGPTEDAELSEVALVRLNDAGQVEREILDLEELSDEYQVQGGDVIYIPKQDIRETVDFAGRLFNPIGALFNIIFGFGNLF